MNKDIVKSEYIVWKSATQPPDAGMVQVLETRKAFYSGFFSCFSVINRISNEYTLEEASELLSGVDEELKYFFENLNCKFSEVSSDEKLS